MVLLSTCLVSVKMLTTALRYSFRSTLKEFFDPLKTNNPRTDFYNMYRRESQEYDQDYARPFEDLNTLLIFVSGSIFLLGTHP